MSGRSIVIPVGAGSPTIFAKNQQSQKPARPRSYCQSIVQDMRMFSLKLMQKLPAGSVDSRAVCR
jgi:hypothetical protein